MFRWTISILLVLLLASCKRVPAAPPTTVALPTKTIVELHSITQLPPNRIVHVAVDTLGNIFYTIETDDAHDGVIVVGETGIPRATQLTSDNILAAMGETVGGSGTIQDLIPGPGGVIYFYFIGGKGKSLRACVGQYRLRGETIRILFDTQQLMDQSQMGESIVLARGSLLANGAQIFLLLRHTDAAVILSFDARGSAAPSVNLSRVLPTISAEDQKFDLVQDQYSLFGSAAGNLLLLDKSSGQLWTVDSTSGFAKPAISLAGLPRDLSKPIAGRDQITFFAADSERIETDMSDLHARTLPKAVYPALLRIDGDQVSAISRDDLRAWGGFPIYAMRVHELAPAPDGSLIAYDLS
ncbi:MAG TPA: hypothetical protein VGF52_03790, partial [Tepidisphaeraceae bacterium]